MKKSVDAIKKTIQILNSVSYENYSDGKIKTYLKYIEGSRADEDKLISPILFYKFLEQVLHFEFGKTIATQESKGIGKPDYIPVDTRTHPFVFDVKGTDTRHLSRHYPQIKKYIESQGLKYGILTNMRDLDVYAPEEKKEIEEYNFNFVKLYQDYKQNSKTCLEKENTKHFLNFVNDFSYKTLTKKEKIERISNAKPWNEKEEFNVKSLTDQLNYIVNIFYYDVKQRKVELLNMAEVGKVSAESIAYEIEEISAQISGRELEKINPETFNKIMDIDESTLYGRARDAFFHRVAYFAMTRLLLTRVWEDIGFINQSLYDGGFTKWYESFNREIRKVLHYAFDLSAERYPWLFNMDNKYSWYEPSDDALIDSLYELSNFYLGKLDQDILGTIYEDYIEKVDKKNKGQYYTPREIVSFIWDRVGYNNPKAFFWHIEGKRVPKFIFDPATGSGGFLVEAARRIRECPDFDWDDLQDLKDIHQAILWYIFGSEISPFPYYLTQVNLLIQLTPVIRKILKLAGKKPSEKPTPLGILWTDSMELHNKELRLFQKGIKRKKKEYQHEILHFTIAEKKIYEKIKEKFAGKFAYVCANPPYIGEKGHKELFRHTLGSYPYWKKYYQGKMDYLYWFIILGLSKLREYGKLGFITSAYWPTADGASKLREYILKNAKIKEMIFFEEVKIFEHAKGQHNMVFVLTKCSGKEHKKEREDNYIKIVQVKCKNQDLPGKSIKENLHFLTNHIQKHISEPRYEDKFIKVFWSGVKQGELTEDSWSLMQSTTERRILSHIELKSSPITELCEIDCGIFSNADFLSKKYIQLIPQHKQNEFSIKTGDGIFVLTENEVKPLLVDDPQRILIKRTYKNSDIDKYFVETEGDIKYLLYIDDNFEPKKFPQIIAHLQKFKEVLQARLDRYGEKYPWYRLHRPHKKDIYEQPKIVTSRWGRKNSYAIQKGNFFENSDINLYIPNGKTQESLEYILALLNSKVLNFWIGYKGRERAVSRQIRLKRIPIKRVNFNNSEEVKVHNEIVEKVKSIREKMVKLAKYSKYFLGPRLTKLDWNAFLSEVNNEAIIRSIHQENLYNLRTHSQINIEKPKGFESENFYLSKAKNPELILTGNAQVKLIGKNRMSLFITGQFEILKLLANILSGWKNKSWSEIKEKILLPDNIISFNTQKTKILNEVQNIRAEILQLQKQIDEMVYKLYNLTNEEIETVKL